MEPIDVSSCISQDPYCFKDLGGFFLFPGAPDGLGFLLLLVFSLRKVSKVLSIRVLAYFPLSKDILSLD